MNSLDLVILVLCGAGAVVGLVHGFSKELLGLLSLGVGILGAKLLCPMVATALQAHVDMSPVVARVLAYVIIFVAIWALGVVLTRAINRFIRRLSLGWLNRLLGALFGGGKWALVISLVLNLCALISPKLQIIPEKTQEESKLYSVVLPLAGITWNKAQEMIHQPQNSSDATPAE